MIKDVKKWAQNLGYDDVIFLKKWENYNLYAPEFDKESVYTGTPIYLLEKNNVIRYATDKVTWEIFDSFEDTEDD